MRFQKHKITAALAITTIVFALLVSPALGEKPIEWKCQVFWGAAELSYKTFVDFTERVKVLTNGRLVITPYPGGALVPTFEALDALRASDGNYLAALRKLWTEEQARVPSVQANPDLQPLDRLAISDSHCGGHRSVTRMQPQRPIATLQSV